MKTKSYENITHYGDTGDCRSRCEDYGLKLSDNTTTATTAVIPYNRR